MGHDIPYLGIKALYAAVERVSAVILRQLVVVSIECETAVLDAIGTTTNDGIEVRLFRLPLVERGKTEYHILAYPLRIPC